MATQQDATVNIHVNNQDAEEKVKGLSARARQLRQEFAEAVRIGDKGTIAKTEKELKKVNKELNNATLRAARVRDAMKHLSQATPKELQNTLKLINQELNSGAVKRGSKEWKAYQEQIKQVNAELRKIQAESRETESTLNRANNFLTKWGNAIVGGMAAMAGVTMAGKQAVQAYADMDSALANTQKYTGMAREDVERLNEEFKKMDTRTSREGLNELAQAAGRLGKNSVEDVMGFVRAGDIIGVAMDELGADAPQIISQLAGIFNLEGELGTEKAMLSVGSAINTLSQNCAAGAPNLVDFASRMGAVANSTNMSMDEMLAFGALLDDQKVSVEKASTAMQGVITKMYADPATFAKKVGLNVQEFTDALKRSSTEGIMMFVDALSKMDSMQQAATLKDLGTAGAGVVQTFQTLAGKTDLLNQQMQTSKQAFDDATSATEEFNVQNNTVQAQLDKAKKGFNEMAVELGEHLYPVMKYAISGTSLLMRGMKVLVEFIINHKGAIIALTAAYVAYQIAANRAMIAEKAYMVVTKAATALKYAWTTALKLSAAAVALCTGNVHKATVAWRAFSMALKANPMGLLIGGITAVVGGITALALSTRKATDETKKLEAEQKELLKGFTDISKSSADIAKNETTQLKRLYNAATDETRSKKERINAAKDLIKMYPTYFEKIKAETIMVGDAKKQYDDLTASIIASAKAKAASAKIEENEGLILDLQMQRDANQQKQKDLYKDVQNAEKDLANYKGGTKEVYDPTVGQYVYTDYTNERVALEQNVQKAKAAWEAAGDEMIEIDANIKTLQKANEWLESKAEPVAISSTIEPEGGNTPPLSDEELEERRKEAEAAAKKAIEDELALKKSARDKEHAINLSAYSQGQKNYLEYVEEKHRIDINAIQAQKKVLADAKLTETEEYNKLLKKEEELNAKHLQTQSQLKKEQLDREHKTKENEITSKYLDPKDNTYSSEKSYRQALFNLDVEYLKKKRNLYAKGTKEWEDANQAINDKIAQDQLSKQKETADALAHFQEEYGKASGSAREKMELDVLEELYKQKLISEEDYNRAKNAIRDKYRNEDRERERTVHNEYSDMVINLYDSFKKFFDDLGKEGTDFWANLSSATEAAYAIMATALSQYSAYTDAERDLELAKIEQRYDAEIEAAGKNSKKKEQLEKQKEAEIAKVKKKYNDRAMKIELAQAIAQTAMSAIAAYAAGLQVGGPAGLVLAPIAAALAVAAGALQIATIKKQHQAQAMGYYEGGFTGKSLDNHKEVGVVHANEFVANHKAVANPRLAPLFNLLDSAQRNNTVGSLTAQDVSNALGQGRGVTARAEVANTTNEQVGAGLALVGATLTSAGNAIDRLNKRIDDGIETVMIMDGERGFARKYENYNKLINRAR